MNASRRATGEMAAEAERGETTTSPGEGCAATCGQPWKATSALATMNISAAPASSEPLVPMPARYARVARATGPARPGGRGRSGMSRG